MERETGINKTSTLAIKIENMAQTYDNPQDFIYPDTKERLMASGAQNISGLITERIVKHSHVEYPSGFLDEFNEAIKDEYVPILVTNHTSHADAAVTAKFISILIKEANTVLPEDEKMTMFTVPLAASLEMGQQGSKLRQFYLGAKPVVERYGFNPNLIVRSKDQRPPEEGGYGMKGNLKGYLRRHKERLQGTRNGTLLYPEGTTEGGKIGENGLPVGMVKFEEFSIPVHLRLTEDFTGKKPMIITAGITGSHNVINANTKSASWNRLWSSYAEPDQFILKVGEIIRTDNSQFKALGGNGELNDFVGRRIALLLPPEMRGVYK